MIRIMSQNQWNTVKNRDDWADMGLDSSAETRMRGHVRVFSELMPDIVGGQEVNKDMQLYFKLYCFEKNLPYTIIWGNMTPIIYRADKFELLDTEYFLYPKTVGDFEGEFNDSASKSVNIGVFREKATGAVFCFATTHLWWKSDAVQAGSSEVRRRQIAKACELVSKYQQKYGNCPAFLVGDLNDCFNSPAVQYTLNDCGFEHAKLIATDYSADGVGYNACGIRSDPVVNGGPGKFWWDKPFVEAIDHILVKDAKKGAVKRFDRYCPDYYLYLSDHAPVYIDVEL